MNIFEEMCQMQAQIRAGEVSEPEIESIAAMQFSVIRQYISAYQQSLADDPVHDVGLLLTDFGESVLMEVTQISYEGPCMMVFHGLVNGIESILIQNVNRLNFLITSVRKDPAKPHNQIGFTFSPAEGHSKGP